MTQNKDLVADAQTLLEENLSEKKSVESARRLMHVGYLLPRFICIFCKIFIDIFFSNNLYEVLKKGQFFLASKTYAFKKDTCLTM